MKKYIQFIESKNYDIIEKQYYYFQNVCSTVSNFISIISKYVHVNVYNIYYKSDGKLVAEFEDEFCNFAEYIFTKTEHKNLINYLNENYIKKSLKKNF